MGCSHVHVWVICTKWAKNPKNKQTLEWAFKLRLKLGVNFN